MLAQETRGVESGTRCVALALVALLSACGLRDLTSGVRHRVVAVGWQGAPGDVLETCRPREPDARGVRALGPQLWEATDEGTTRFACAGGAATRDVLLEASPVARVVLEAPRRLRVGELGTLEFHGVGAFGRRLELGALATTTLDRGLSWARDPSDVAVARSGILAGLEVRGATVGTAHVVGRFAELQAEAAVDVVP